MRKLEKAVLALGIAGFIGGAYKCSEGYGLLIDKPTPLIVKYDHVKTRMQDFESILDSYDLEEVQAGIEKDQYLNFKKEYDQLSAEKTDLETKPEIQYFKKKVDQGDIGGNVAALSLILLGASLAARYHMHHREEDEEEQEEEEAPPQSAANPTPALVNTPDRGHVPPPGGPRKIEMDRFLSFR